MKLTRKSKLKLICLLLVITMLSTMMYSMAISGIITDELYSETDCIATEAIIAEYGIEFWRNYKGSVCNIDIIRASFPRTRAGNSIYPSYFGGFYINDDGVLTTLIVENARSESFNNASEYMLGLETILAAGRGEFGRSMIIRYVEFSYAELNTKRIHIREFIRNNFEREAAINILSFYVDVINNKIVVNVIDGSDEQIATFRREITDSPMVTFRELGGEPFSLYDYIAMLRPPVPNVVYTDNDIIAEEYSTPLSNGGIVQPGQPIFARFNGVLTEIGSMGFRMSRSDGSRPGFITSAHVVGAPDAIFPVGTSIYNSAGNAIGSISASTDVRFQLIDAAFVQLNTGWQVSNIPFGLTNVSALTFTARTPVVGEFVVKRGGTTPLPISSSRIVRAHYDFNVGRGWDIEVTITNYASRHGDSGGIVWHVATGQISGIHHARHPRPNSPYFDHALFTRAVDIAPDFSPLVLR